MTRTNYALAALLSVSLHLSLWFTGISRTDARPAFELGDAAVMLYLTPSPDSTPSEATQPEVLPEEVTPVEQPVMEPVVDTPIEPQPVAALPPMPQADDGWLPLPPVVEEQAPPQPQVQPQPVVQPEPQEVEPQPLEPQPAVEAQPRVTEQPTPAPQPAPQQPEVKPAAQSAVASAASVQQDADQQQAGVEAEALVSHLHQPRYPFLSRRRGEEGQAQVLVRVEADGRVTQVTLEHSSGFDRLDQAALDACRKSRFVPATENGQPVTSWARVPFVFSLK